MILYKAAITTGFDVEICTDNSCGPAAASPPRIHSMRIMTKPPNRRSLRMNPRVKSPVSDSAILDKRPLRPPTNFMTWPCSRRVQLDQMYSRLGPYILREGWCPSESLGASDARLYQRDEALYSNASASHIEFVCRNILYNSC